MSRCHVRTGADKTADRAGRTSMRLVDDDTGDGRKTNSHVRKPTHDGVQLQLPRGDDRATSFHPLCLFLFVRPFP